MKNKLLTLAVFSVVLQFSVNHAAYAEHEQQNQNKDTAHECKAGMDSTHCKAMSNLDDMQKKAGDMKSMMENCMHCMTPEMMEHMSGMMKNMDMMMGQMQAAKKLQNETTKPVSDAKSDEDHSAHHPKQ